MKPHVRWLPNLVPALLAVLVSTAQADIITYQFTTTVRTVDPSALNFPSSLSGVAVNDSITGTITYDSASPSVANPFTGSVFGDATLYSLNSASVSIIVDGVSFETWSGQLSAFVWNDDLIFGSSHDGINFMNIPLIGQPQFQIGNIILPSSAFADESLPTQNISPAGLDLHAVGGAPWLQSNGFLLEQVAPLPTPGAAAGGMALIALLAAKRRTRTPA